MSAILQHDFDSGLMSMHNGLLEDKTNNPKWELTPGYYFMSLNEQATAQAFKPFVDGMIVFLRRRLDSGRKSYTKTNKGVLTYGELRTTFLDNASLPEDIRFYFVYSLIRVWHLRRLHKSKMGDSLMAPLIYSNAIFDLLLVLDELLKRWDNPQGSRQYFSDHYNKLAKKEGWYDLGRHNVNKRRDDDFIKWCTELLDGSYRTQAGESTGLLERDFIFAYGLRNLSAHSIKSYELLWSNYTKVLQAVFNCIFKTVELIK